MPYSGWMKTVLLTLSLALAGLAGAAETENSSRAGVAFMPQSPVFGSSSTQEATNDPLPAERAFTIEAKMTQDGETGATVAVTLTPQEGYYLYRERVGVSSENAKLEDWEAPRGRSIDDPNFGIQEVFEHSVEFFVPVAARVGEQVDVDVAFQGCKDGSICYPPMTKRFTLDVPGHIPFDARASKSPVNTIPGESGGPTTGRAEDQRLADLLAQRPMWQALAIYLGLGVLLGLTPCVLPMVPILLGVVVGRNSTTKKTVSLAGAYVLAHALVFAAMGAAAAAIGSGVAGMFQSMWMILPMSVLLAGLGVAMLMGVEIQMPARVQAWAAAKGGGGTLRGAAVMGGLSSLIIGPCVAPPLAGAVLYLAHSGNILLGSAALFALGLGMGLPMLLMATGMGRWLPRSEKINTWLSAVFGIAFIVLAGWLAGRVVPGWIVGLAGGVGLLAVAARQYQGRDKAQRWTGQGWAQAGVLGGVLMVAGVGLWGQQLDSSGTEGVDGLFTPVATNSALDDALARADMEGKMTVVEFYAHWCTACKDMERKTYSTPAVQLQIKDENIMALKIDVSSNDEEDQKLMKRFGIIGPPATLFFNDTVEARDLRLVGFEPEIPFIQRVQAAKCRSTERVGVGTC